MKRLLIAACLIPAACLAQLVSQQPASIVATPNVPAINIVGSTNQVAPYIVVKTPTGTLASLNTSGAWNKATLATTATVANGVSFTATNAAPAVTTNVAAWVAVTISGDTNVYRLPLYK